MDQTRKQIDSLYDQAYVLRHSDTSKAEILCGEALAISEEINYVNGQAKCHGLMGFVLLQNTKYSEAFEALERSMALSGNNEEMRDAEAFALYCIGIIYSRLGNFSLAIETLRKSLALRKLLNDTVGIAACDFQLGFCSYSFREYENALFQYQESLKNYEKIKDEIGAASALNGIGSVYTELNDFENAKASFFESAKRREGLNDPKGLGTNYYMLSMMFVKEKNYKEAEEYILKGLAIANSLGEKAGIARMSEVLGNIYVAIGKSKEAIETLKMALDLAQRSNIGSIEYQIHGSLAELYEQQGDTGLALQHHKKFHTLKEEVINSQTAVKIKHIELFQQMETTKKEAEITHLRSVELKHAYDEIEQKNKDITDSMRYARRIQQSLLPNEIYIEKNLNRLMSVRN